MLPKHCSATRSLAPWLVGVAPKYFKAGLSPGLANMQLEIDKRCKCIAGVNVFVMRLLQKRTENLVFSESLLLRIAGSGARLRFGITIRIAAGSHLVKTVFQIIRTLGIASKNTRFGHGNIDECSVCPR